MASISWTGKSILSMSSIPKLSGNGKQGIQIIGSTDRLVSIYLKLKINKG